MKRTSRRGLIGATALGFALFAAACGASPPEVAATAEAPAADVVEETGGAGLPQLVATTVAGAQIDTNDLAGQDVVVWFWAPW